MPGDAMFLRLRSRNATYVYVLDEDALGALVALYPVPGTEPINPLAAGVNHRLPGSVGGKPFDWEVTSAGGTESICVIASRAPIDALESELARVPHSRPGVPVSYARIPRAAVHRLRGLAGMTEAIAPEGGSPERLAELVHDLLSRPAAAGRPWVWVLTLENPGVAGTVR